MRILFLITKGDIGGAQKNVFLISKNLKKDGFEVFVGIGEKGFLSRDLEKEGIRVKIFNYLKRTQNPIFSIFFVFELRQFLRVNDFDLISFNSSNTIFGVLSMFGMKNKPKTVFTVHGSSFLSPGFKRSRILKLLLLCSMRIFMPLFDKIIFVSEYDKKLAEQYELIKNGQGIVIYNGTEDINFLNKEEAIKGLRKIKNFPDDRLIIGTITRLEYAKGNDILIETINKLPREILDKCVFLVIGDGPDKENLKSQISNLKIQEKVFLLGDIPEAARYLKTFDIFIMTSRYEGMPYALLEAMSANLPIIAPNVGGIPESLGDSGMIFDTNNIDDLISNLTNLINSPSLREQLSQKSKNQIQKFSFSKNLQQIKNLFIFLGGSG